MKLIMTKKERKKGGKKNTPVDGVEDDSLCLAAGQPFACIVSFSDCVNRCF
jgi:hypothetical protein